MTSKYGGPVRFRFDIMKHLGPGPNDDGKIGEIEALDAREALPAAWAKFGAVTKEECGLIYVVRCEQVSGLVKPKEPI